MIDVQPYIDKLEKLKEYMALVIDNRGSCISFNTDVFSSLRPNDIIDLYLQTGIMFYRDGYQQSKVKKLTFEEWLSPLKNWEELTNN